MEELNYRIVPDYDELEKKYWIRFKNLEVVSSWIYEIYMLVINEIDWKKFKYEDYSKMAQDEEKIIWDLWVITYLYQFENEEKFEKYKSIITDLNELEWKFDWIQRPRIIWEFEYKWRYFLIVTNKELSIKAQEFDDMIQDPEKYLKISKERKWFSDKVSNIV